MTSFLFCLPLMPHAAGDKDSHVYDRSSARTEWEDMRARDSFEQIGSRGERQRLTSWPEKERLNYCKE